MNCYRESYIHNKRKKDVFDMYNYIKQYQCCDSSSCNKMAFDIQRAKNLCNDAFSYQHETDEKGNIIGNTLCNELLLLQKNAEKKIDSYSNPNSNSIGGSHRFQKKTLKKRKCKKIKKRKKTKRR